MWVEKHRIRILICFGVLLLLSALSASRIYFNYEFEHFFPKGDKDLDFYYEFRSQFEPDDNFLLVALDNEPDVFEPEFLVRLDSLSRIVPKISTVESALSITSFRNPVKTPFGFSAFPIVHPDDPERYGKDSTRMMQDPRVAGQLISADGKTAVLAIKTMDTVLIDQSRELVDSVEMYLAGVGLDDYHMLGRAYFQKELVRIQEKEFIISTLISGVLVTIVFLLIFRRFWGVLIALSSVLLGMAIFVGYLGQFSNPLDFMSALYPVLMIIVGVSDVVHLMTKYVQELRKGNSKSAAIATTLREIGLATFLTSFTTAIGFATLMTSKVGPVRVFGFNAAIGVLLAYGTIILFCTALISLFPEDKISAHANTRDGFRDFLERIYQWGRSYPAAVGSGLLIAMLFAIAGISMISTDVQIYSGLPRGERVTEDFSYFEERFAGFRPFEIAALPAGDRQVHEYEVIEAMDAVEKYVSGFDEVSDMSSVTTIYKSMNRAHKGDRLSAYIIPENEKDFKRYKRLLDKFPLPMADVLVSRDGSMARMTGKVKDVGGERIAEIIADINAWAAAEIDPDLLQIKVTGTGVAFDKNNEYLRDSLISGLSIAFISVSLLMALLFRNWRMVLISLVPNVIPLLICGGFIGYLGIQLDAPTAIIFAISFGIAVDDTIHFLSKYKLEIDKGRSMEQAIHTTFMEAGKAIVITSIILFFGFLILLTSKTPGTFTVGLLIALTLGTAVIADLFTIPLLLRWWMPGETASSNTDKKGKRPEVIPGMG